MYDSLLAESKAVGLMPCFSLEPSIKADCESFEVLQDSSGEATLSGSLTPVWWSNFPLRPEQPNEPNTSADTDKELFLLCDSVREVMTWWTLCLFGIFKLSKQS